MPYLNRIEIIGAVVSPVKFAAVSHDREAAFFQVETRQTWIDNDGQEHSRAERHSVDVCGRLASSLKREQIAQGDLLYITGKMQYKANNQQGAPVSFRAEIYADSWQLL